MILYKYFRETESRKNNEDFFINLLLDIRVAECHGESVCFLLEESCKEKFVDSYTIENLVQEKSSQRLWRHVNSRVTSVIWPVMWPSFQNAHAKRDSAISSCECAFTFEERPPAAAAKVSRYIRSVRDHGGSVESAEAVQCQQEGDNRTRESDYIRRVLLAEKRQDQLSDIRVSICPINVEIICRAVAICVLDFHL